MFTQARRHDTRGVVDELPVDDVGQSAFQTAQRFLVALAGRPFASVVGACSGVAGELSDRHDVQGVVELTVSGAREPMSHNVTGGDLDRGEPPRLFRKLGLVEPASG